LAETGLTPELLDDLAPTPRRPLCRDAMACAEGALGDRRESQRAVPTRFTAHRCSAFNQ